MLRTQSASTCRPRACRGNCRRAGYVSRLMNLKLTGARGASFRRGAQELSENDIIQALSKNRKSESFESDMYEIDKKNFVS